MFLFWMLVGFVIEWAIELWYWRGTRTSGITAPLEARVKELEEELRRASLVTAAGRTSTTSSRQSAGAAQAPKAEAAAAASAPASAPDSADGPVLTSRRSTRRDDLKVIDGIGEVFEDKLFAAGITTYNALSTMSGEEIAAIIQPADWQNYDFYAWIRQAGDLAKKV